MSGIHFSTETTFQNVVNTLNTSGPTDLSDKVLAVKDWSGRREGFLNGVGKNDDADRSLHRGVHYYPGECGR